ncbi:MAG TPA: MBL fold metallo-hydrolase [Rhabdochlamydiaceae bacterium]|nr:MBL fold metallo-hydrolase [Rhabdochlamydiaceae bacterium]
MRSEVRILSGAMFLKVFTTGPAETNCTLIGCDQTRQAAIVDVPLDSTELIVQALKKESLVPQMILLTHSHWDHIADIAKLKNLLEIPLYVHPEDAENLERPGADGLPLPFPIEGAKPDKFLVDGQMIPLGDLKIEVICTPGHTPGGVCFWLKQQKILISGDTLFRGTIGNISFPTSDPEQMWESLKRLAHLPPDTRVFPGHGPETTIQAESWIAHAKDRFEQF